MRMLTEQSQEMEMALGSMSDQEHNKWGRQTGRGVLEEHDMALCETVCIEWHSHSSDSWSKLTWWFLPAQLEQTQGWFPYSQKPSLEGAWRPRWSSIRNMKLYWCLAVREYLSLMLVPEGSRGDPCMQVSDQLSLVAELEVESLRSIRV